METVHYRLKTTSMTGIQVNAEVSYDVYFDNRRGIAYEVELRDPGAGLGAPLQPVWHARVVNDLGQRRLEYDILQRIYYRTRQDIQVESAMYKLQENLAEFLASEGLVPVEPVLINGESFPGYRLHTLSIWFDPSRQIPVRRVNRDRGNVITDEFVYESVNQPLPGEVFNLPKPAEAIAEFDLYPEAPVLPRFENVTETPQNGIYVNTLLDEIKRHVVLNQWEYGRFSTLKLPWETEMPATIYRGRTEGVLPPIVVTLDVPDMGRTYFFITYDFLGYVVSGFTQDEFPLDRYERLPISASVILTELVPLYAAPSHEKDFVVQNFVRSVQSNDFIINAFDMGGRVFDMVVKNFSFHENEGYLILNIYGKEYWDNANIEAMFNFVVTGQMADAHTTPILIYAVNTLKRMGVHRQVRMPEYIEVPGI